MDLLCDYVVEEILLHLPLKYLHRLRAVSRRYNALVLRPGFATRYWGSHGPHLSGVFLQSERMMLRPSFLAAPGRHHSSVLASDLGFLPNMQTGSSFVPDERMVFIVHSACGLLLCCRGLERQTQFYVCNPVTWQCVALPELPWPHDEHQWHSGLLTLAGDGYGNITSFQVVLVNHHSRWPRKNFGGSMDLKVFSSEAGEWRQYEFKPQPLDVENPCYSGFLSQSGTAYWIGTGTGVLVHRQERVVGDPGEPTPPAISHSSSRTRRTE